MDDSASTSYWNSSIIESLSNFKGKPNSTNTPNSTANPEKKKSLVDKMGSKKGAPSMSLAVIFNTIFYNISQSLASQTIAPAPKLPSIPINGIGGKCIPTVPSLVSSVNIMTIIKRIFLDPKYYIRIFASNLCNVLSINGVNDGRVLDPDVEIIVNQIVQFFLIIIIFIFTINLHILSFYENYKEAENNFRHIKMFGFTETNGIISPPIKMIYEILFTSKFGGVFQIMLSYILACPYYFNDICFNWICRLIKGMIGYPIILFIISLLITYFVVYNHLGDIVKSFSLYFNGYTNNLSSMLFSFIVIKLFFDIIAVFVSTEIDKASVMAMLSKFTLLYMIIMFFYLLFEILYNMMILPITSTIFIINILVNLCVPIFINPTEMLGRVIEQIIVGNRLMGLNPYSKSSEKNETGNNNELIYGYTFFSKIVWIVEMFVIMFFEVIFGLFFLNCILDCASNMHNLDLVIAFIILNILIMGVIVWFTFGKSNPIYTDFENNIESENYKPPSEDPITHKLPKFICNNSIMKSLFLSKDIIKIIYSEKLPEVFLDNYKKKSKTTPDESGGLMNMFSSFTGSPEKMMEKLTKSLPIDTTKLMKDHTKMLGDATQMLGDPTQMLGDSHKTNEKIPGLSELTGLIPGLKN